jgi:hypothetical protein
VWGKGKCIFGFGGKTSRTETIWKTLDNYIEKVSVLRKEVGGGAWTGLIWLRIEKGGAFF